MTRLPTMRRPLLGAARALALRPALAAVGARMLVQVWSPLAPRQQALSTLLDDKSLVHRKPDAPALDARQLSPSTSTPAQVPSALH